MKTKIKKVLLLALIAMVISCSNQTSEKEQLPDPSTVSIDKSVLQDKIKGGWAGQVIGCTFGGPTEFRFKGGMINDYQPISWDENSCLWYYQNQPGLYDDIYMDLTFVDVFEKEGLDAPAASHAMAFANAEYRLWHANQAARYNILNGIMPPQSGHWLYNPHSEDIDFQIEADFAGLMSPGMVNTASEICDKVGHIMNYGDGWYGGVYVAAMYSLAFVSKDINYVVEEALNVIPEESDFYKCISDVIQWHKQFPDDWKQTWFETEKKWSADIGCPNGVFKDFNIDAKINAAYVVIGLLYGDGDYSKTLEISTRCGQDSDCNPASAGGILGTLIGYSNIPEFWKKGVYPVEDMDFKYTTMSLNDVYEISTRHALQVLERKGVKIDGDQIIMPIEEIQPVVLEVGFEGHYPVERIGIRKNINSQTPDLEFNFTGNGFVLTGNAISSDGDAVIEMEMSIDDSVHETILMPTSFTTRKHEIAWKYQLNDGPHKVKIFLKNPTQELSVRVEDVLVYSSKKIGNTWKT